jgi:hypothetical protein
MVYSDLQYTAHLLTLLQITILLSYYSFSGWPVVTEQGLLSSV